MATMDDVAKAANVSVTTVSHVLNGTRKVKPETEELVRQAISEVGYIQNSLARSLAMSATSTIGVAIPTFSNHYFVDIVRSIEAEVGHLVLKGATSMQRVTLDATFERVRRFDAAS